MKQWVVAFGLLLVLTAVAAPAPAQTRVSVAVGFGVPRPYVSGVVVVRRPYFYRPYFYRRPVVIVVPPPYRAHPLFVDRSEEHTSELQSQSNLVCRLLLEKKKKKKIIIHVCSKIAYIRC